MEQLVRIPGVGKKTAERMVLELRDKLDVTGLPGADGCAAPKSAFNAGRRRRDFGADEFRCGPRGGGGGGDARRGRRRSRRFRPAVPPGVETGCGRRSHGAAVPREQYTKTSCGNRASFRRRCARKSGNSKPRCGRSRLADFAGQPKVKENLAIAIEAAKRRGEAMDHVLLYGPPGLGKTTLAGIIAAELGVGFQQTSGPVLQKKLDLSGILSNIQEREVFFIDEIHRLLPDVEEMIYSALEDFRMDILIGTGPGARTHAMDIKHFTAIGATTRQGLISAPLRGRFGLVLRLNHYDMPDLARIVQRSARLLEVQIDEEGAAEIARRSRGTPRIANRLLRRVRDYAQVRAAGHIELDVAQPRSICSKWTARAG